MPVVTPRPPAQVQRPGTWAQIALDLSILTQLLRLLRWAGRIKQDITQWATTLGQGLAQELDYQQVRGLHVLLLQFATAPQGLSCCAASCGHVGKC